MTERESSRPQLNPGSIALAVMGWVELSISVILFLLGIYFTSIAFAVSGLVLGVVANQILRQRASFERRMGRAPVSDAAANRVGSGRQIAFLIVLLLGATLLVVGVILIVRQSLMPGVIFGLWACSLAVIALRIRGLT